MHLHLMLSIRFVRAPLEVRTVVVQQPYTTQRGTLSGEAIVASIVIVDRVQNLVEVFETRSYEHVSTYDLVSVDGKSGRSGATAACFDRSVLDDAELPLNDPAPDLMEFTPDGKYLAIAFRGPVPVSVAHTAQGSCPVRS